MTSASKSIVTLFEKYKADGLSYHQATQALQSAGYSRQDIIDASYYDTYVSNGVNDGTSRTSEAVDAIFETTAADQRRINELENKMNQHMIKSHYPIGGWIWAVLSVFSWSNYQSSSLGAPKSKIYLAYVFAILLFYVFTYLSVTFVLSLDLPTYLIIICFISSFFLAQYCLRRILRYLARNN